MQQSKKKKKNYKGMHLNILYRVGSQLVFSYTSKCSRSYGRTDGSRRQVIIFFLVYKTCYFFVAKVASMLVFPKGTWHRTISCRIFQKCYNYEGYEYYERTVRFITFLPFSVLLSLDYVTEIGNNLPI